MSESIVRSNKKKSKSDFKMKNTIGDGMKMLRKYQLTFYKSNLQMLHN